MSEEPNNSNFRQGMHKQSSFARSFFNSEANPPALQAQQRRSGGNSSGRRKSSQRNTQNFAMAAAAAAASADDHKEPSNLPHLKSTGESNNNDRANSWYVDAVRQQGGSAENLTELLGDASLNNQNTSSNTSGWNDDEVLEQYRLMAQHEANLRVMENTGFDAKEYERRRKLGADVSKDKKGLYGGTRKPKQRLPEPRKIAASSGDTVLKPVEPPKPPKLEHRRFVEQRVQRVPDLCPGEVLHGSASVIPSNECVVPCLGSCGKQLRVNRLATLVHCPACHTVSPATSMRR